jgi:uroporphyrinogen III methyltransferase/synthase
MKTIKIGTRKSLLALVQTDIVKNKIKEAFPDINVEIVKIDTKGDQLLDRSLASFGGKGVFTRELEEQLLSGQIDIAVHSAKDMPNEFPEGLGIGAILDRADPRDVFATTTGLSLKDLKPGSVVGTSSLRRELQIKAINPHVTIKVLRGNVQTRLRKLKEGQYDGIILAAAGLSRLGYEENEDFHYEYMDTEEFLPAAGQGILAVESRDGDWQEVLASLHSEQGALMLQCEREFLKQIGGSCNAPAAAYSRLEGDQMKMEAFFAGDGKHRTYTSRAVELTGTTLQEKVKQAKELGAMAAKDVTKGKVYLIGAGPGDMGLFTLKGLEIIRKADVVVYDNLATDSILNEVKDTAELIYAGKRAAKHYLKQEETNMVLVEKALEGKMVARLKGGDPFIFGRGGEEAAKLVEYGIEFEVVPGISSSYSVPAYCGIPVTHREAASSFHVITGHEGNHKNGSTVLDYQTLAKEEGTLIFLMGLGNLPNITKSLMENGKNPATPVAVLQEGTTARQRVAVGTLETIVDEVKHQGIQTPAISVVGDVVNLRETIDWYGKKPLSGKSVLVTGTKAMCGRLTPRLREEGAEAIEFSLVNTEKLIEESLVNAIEEIKDYTWAVFTSANGVRFFFEYLKENRIDLRSLHALKFAVIGEGTAKALEERGIFYEYLPTAYSSKDMAEQMIPRLTKEDKVLLLRAKEASKELPDALEKAGVSYTAVSLYHTVYDRRKADELNRIIRFVDYITFASSSAVKAFWEMVEDKDAIVGKCISIGPVTTKTADQLGLTIDQTASVYSAEGIVDVLLADQAE